MFEVYDHRQIIDKHPHRAVKVLATSYHNGYDFGEEFPFSHHAQWILDAMINQTVYPVLEEGTTYASWCVITPEGIKIATPNDWIVRVNDTSPESLDDVVG